MNLSQLFSRVARGPVGDLAVGGDSSGIIPVANSQRIVDAIQATLTKLHTRFPLQLKLLTLGTVDGLYDYPLRVEFAQSSTSLEINKFIDDTASPFLGDLLAIEHVLDGNSLELPLNDRKDPLSWFTSSYDTLNCGYPVTGETYFVQYRANHAQLALELIADPEDPESVVVGPTSLAQKILVPAALENALMACIAYEVYSSQSSADAQAKSQVHYQLYEQACAEIENRNTVNSSVIEDRAEVIRLGGWV